jgi:hypothetical protein
VVPGRPSPGCAVAVGYRPDVDATMEMLDRLLALRGVREDVDAAREAVDRALRHPAVRRTEGRVGAEVSLRSAWAGAALEGHRYALADLRAGTVTDPVVQGALRVSAALESLAGRWSTAPRQVLARLHVLAGTGSVAEPELGRPVFPAGPGAAHGSTHLDAPTRLDALCDLVVRARAVGGVPGSSVVVAALVHGELLALRPFAGPGGLVARAAGRLSLIAGGLDRYGQLAPELGHLAREPEYLGAAQAYATGTQDGLRAWLRHCAAAIGLAAAQLVEIAESG